VKDEGSRILGSSNKTRIKELVLAVLDLDKKMRIEVDVLL